VPLAAAPFVLQFDFGLLQMTYMSVSPSSSGVPSGASASTVVGKSDFWGSLYGDHGEVSALKRRGYRRIGTIFLAGLASSVVAGVFLGAPACVVTCIVVGIVPHFTPRGTLGIFFEADRAIKAKMYEVFGQSITINSCDSHVNSPHSVANNASDADIASSGMAVKGVLILNKAWLGEARAEADPNLRMEILRLYKQVLDIFNGAMDRRSVLGQVIRAINDANLSTERKALFVRAAQDYVDNVSPPEADSGSKPGVLRRMAQWCGFVRG
jgi:hypothetical protein